MAYAVTTAVGSVRKLLNSSHVAHFLSDADIDARAQPTQGHSSPLLLPAKTKTWTQPGVLSVFCVLVLSFVCLCLIINNNSINSNRKPKLRFPGPRQFPLIGRVHDLPEKYLWLKLTEWARQYGPIYYTSMLGARLVVVSDERIARELLVKRSSKYSGRPQIPALVAHTQTPDYLPLMGRSEHWSLQRKFAHAAISESVQHGYHGVMDYEAKRVATMILLDPEQVQTHLEDQASRIICTLCWGDTSQSRVNAQTALTMLRQMSPAGTIANRLTPLNKLPLFMNPWAQKEQRRYKAQTQWWLEVYRDAKARFHKGALSSNTWAHRYLVNLERDAGTLAQNADQEAKSANALGMLCLLGTYTVMPQVCFLLMAFVEHSEWLQKCQREMDEVCGSRPPTLADYSKLVKLRACIKETLRWRPNVPLGVPHEVEQADHFEGVHIKKGTLILALQWSIARNAHKYPDPESWRPERWLEASWPTYSPHLDENLHIQDMTAFGWGKRSCIGARYSQDMLFITAGMLTYAFDFRHKRDFGTGQKNALDTQASNSYVILNPDPFQMEITARSRERAAEMVREFGDAERNHVV